MTAPESNLLLVHALQWFVDADLGTDRIVVDRYDAAAGTLEPCGPFFAIDPSGRWLVAANQASDSIVVFRVDPETGMPAATGSTVTDPAPVCVLFET